MKCHDLLQNNPIYVISIECVQTSVFKIKCVQYSGRDMHRRQCFYEKKLLYIDILFYSLLLFKVCLL